MFQTKPTVPGPVFDTSTVLAMQLLPLELAGALGIPGPCLWSPQLLLGQPAPAPSPPWDRILLCCPWFILCARSRLCCNAARSHQREPVPRWQERFWAALSLQGSCSPVPAGCRALERAPDSSAFREGARGPRRKKGWKGSVLGARLPLLVLWENPVPWDRHGPGRGMRRVCCSPSAPVFLVVNVLAAGETRQPSPGMLC